MKLSSNALEVLKRRYLLKDSKGRVVETADRMFKRTAKCIAKGNSKLEKDKLDLAKDILKKAEERDVKLVLPLDHIVADKVDEGANVKEVGKEIPDSWIGLDIGKMTVKKFKEILSSAKTVVWNGPLGVFELEPFAKGTEVIAADLAELDGTTVVCGGDTVSAVTHLGVAGMMSHVSTGGGASLEMLEGKELPGLAALTDG